MSAEIPHFARTGIDIAHRKIIHPYLTRGEAREDRVVAHEARVACEKTLLAVGGNLTALFSDHECIPVIDREYWRANADFNCHASIAS